MRVITLCALLALMVALLGGCQSSGELENQAYILILGVDRADNGQLLLTAKVPKIGKDARESGDGSSSDGAYLTFSVVGDSWPQALEALQQATPRQTNLSHIEMLVVSEKLASEPDFPALMNRIADTPHLYTTARFVVCAGSARTFVEAEETIIGSRLAAELRAMLKHYAVQGYIPDSSFANACFAVNSMYSDPVAIWADMEGSDMEKTMFSDGNTSRQLLETPMEQRYSGTALFSGGMLCGRLNADETRLLNLITGKSKSLLVDRNGVSCQLTVTRRVTKSVAIASDSVQLELSLGLSARDEPLIEDKQRMEEDLANAIAALIQKCQRMRCDPFGFAEAAAGHFTTVPEWLSFGWRERFAAGALEVDVIIRTDSAL